jgi:D-arabinose 1-dehydrogenase-like Zn-dependent alcohol dehydrogenase
MLVSNSMKILAVEALAQMPQSLDAAEAALLMCRVTTFNSLRHSGALPSDLVAIRGHAGFRGDDRRAPHNRKLPARKGC